MSGYWEPGKVLPANAWFPEGHFPLTDCDGCGGKGWKCAEDPEGVLDYIEVYCGCEAGARRRRWDGP